MFKDKNISREEMSGDDDCDTFSSLLTELYELMAEDFLRISSQGLAFLQGRSSQEANYRIVSSII